MLVIVGCSHGSSSTALDGGVPGDDLATATNPPNGPCRLKVIGGDDIFVNSWCLLSPGALTVDDLALTVVGAAGLVRINKTNGAQAIIAGAGGSPHLDGTLADGGDELFVSGFASNGASAIFAVPRAGGTVRIVVATGTTIPQNAHVASIAVDAANIYWLTDGVWKAPRAGGGPPTRVGAVVPAEQGPLSGQLVVGADALYFTRPSAGEVDRQPFDGSASSVIATGNTPGPIAVAGNTVYWIEVGRLGVDCSATDGAIRSWSAGTLQTWAQSLTGASALAPVAGGIVWTESGAECNGSGAAGVVRSLTAPGGTPTPIATGQLFPQAIVSDGSQLYWDIISLYDGNGAILRVPLAP
jgi:hypothetical protein